MTSNDSILHQMDEQGRSARRVTLKGSERDDAATERYAILGEIARGGTGVVHKGRDNDLGRDVALKVLREDHLNTRQFIERFVEEAQIGGQLQHPGIVPVYELGLRSDQRPYFAMKLVKGETLAARLAARKDPTDGRRKLLAVYREVCRTMAYAHARGVIHRDLKPSNVMIGSFGEVQVVDWGFAKVVRKGGVADEKLSEKKERDVTMISTVRSGDGSSHSVAGSVMGTPGYMSPEQAMGRVDDLDEKSDLFGLGAILCEILTGRPPYTGSDTDRMTAAAQARLEPTQERLDACGADERLVHLCKRCLAPLPKDRPSSAQVLADEIAAYLRDAETRAHRAQLRALEAEEQVEAQRRGRRLVTHGGLAAAAALLIAAGTWRWIDHDQTQRERDTQSSIQLALQDAERLKAAGQWSEAFDAAKRAIALGDNGVLAATIRTEAEAAAAKQQRDAEDAALLSELEDVRARRGDEFGDVEADAAWTAAITKRWSSFVVDTDRLKASPHALALAAVFDAWALMRRRVPKLKDKDWQQLDRIARAIDPAHGAMRDALVAEDPAELVAFAESEEALELPPALQATIGSALMGAEHREQGMALLHETQRRHPDDSWIHHRLGMSAEVQKQPAKAALHFTAALALRPHSIELRHRLGVAHRNNGDLEGAIAVWREGITRQPDWYHGYTHVAITSVKLGRDDDAERAFRTALQGEPESPMLLNEYAKFVNRHGGRRAESVDYMRRAAAILDDEPNVRLHLGNSLRMADDYVGAIDAYRACLERSPTPHVAARAHAGLAIALWRTRRREEAEAEIRLAEQNAGEDAWIWGDIGSFFEGKKDLDRALAAFDRSLAANPELASSHENRGYVLLQRGQDDDYEASRQAFERAIALGGDGFLLHARFGALLSDCLQRYDDAITHFERAHQIDPARWEPCQSLGLTLARKRHWDAAAAWLEKAVERARDDAGLLVMLGSNFEQAQKPERALQLYDRAISVAPEHVIAHVNRAWLLYGLRRMEQALAAAESAAAFGPDSWRTHTILGSVLLGSGQPSLAIEPFQKAIALNSGFADLHANLGSALANSGDLEKGRRKFLDALLLDPNHARAHYNLAFVQWQLHELRDALAKFRRGLRLDSRMAGGYPDLVSLKRLHDRLPAVLAGDEEPANTQEAIAFAQLAITVDENHIGGLRLLRAELANQEKHVTKRPRQVARLMAGLQKDRDLAAIRDAKDLGEDFQEFWADLEALKQRAEAAIK